MYKFEFQLIEEFKKILVRSKNPFNVLKLAHEFNYNSGRTDIIANTKNGDLISFEAKLNRWRIAINQAYRNSSFSHYSYVLLPSNIAKTALKSRAEFERRGVGLCSVGSSGINIEIPATKKDPFQPWLTKTALTLLTGD